MAFRRMFVPLFGQRLEFQELCDSLLYFGSYIVGLA